MIAESKLDASVIIAAIDSGQVNPFDAGKMYEKLLQKSNKDDFGVFYTPRPLAACLVRCILEEKLRGCTAQDILGFTICDMSVGCGILLLETIDQLVTAYTRMEPCFSEEADWIRGIIASNCYGSDLDPVAVDVTRACLAKVGSCKPDQRVFSGNSLVGARPSVLPINELTSNLPATPITPGNARPPGTVFHFLLPDPKMPGISRQHLSPFSEAEISDLALVSDLIETETNQATIRQILDYWGAMWFWPRALPMPTRSEWISDVYRIMEMKDICNQRLDTVRDVSDRHRFVHWHTVMPTGFDIMVGNPPWVKLEGQSNEIRSMQAFMVSTKNYPLNNSMQPNLYKAFLELQWTISKTDSVHGMICEPGVLNATKGGPLRAELSLRLRRVLRFSNRKGLFDEIGASKHFVVLATGSRNDKPRYTMQSGIESVDQVGSGSIEVTEETLALFAKLYDDEGTPPLEARLPVVHSQEILSVLRKLAKAPRKLADLEGQFYATEHFDETGRQKDGTIRRDTRPIKRPEEWIISGPHFYVATPFNKNPNEGCRHNQDYSPIDLTAIPDDYLPRTNYVPACSPSEYRKRTPHWQGRPVTEYFRHVHREMVNPTGERTLVPCILPLGAAHINTCFAIAFSNVSDLLVFSGLASSIVVDFFVKSTGMGHANLTLTTRLPCFIPTSVYDAVVSRSLRLNCLTTHYDRLWSEAFADGFVQSGWSKINDARLPPWDCFGQRWSYRSALRTFYARRQALVELDALAALSLGLTADELCLLYRVQFPVLQQYERETFYDQRGAIVFTTSKGLSGVGLSRIEWESIGSAKAGAKLPDFAKDFIPPFDRCDREADMRQAYEFFSRQQLDR